METDLRKVSFCLSKWNLSPSMKNFNGIMGSYKYLGIGSFKYLWYLTSLTLLLPIPDNVARKVQD